MERVMTNKANWLVCHGYEVTVVTTDQRGRAPYFPLHPAIQTYDLGINYDVDNGHLLSKIVHYPLKQWRHRRRLTALLQQIRADIVICMFNNDVSFAYKIQDGSRKILEIHFSKNKKLQYGRHGLWALVDRWRTRQEERIVRHYDHFVVLTEEDKALWGDMPNITVIPNSGPSSTKTKTKTILPQEGNRYTLKRVLAIGRYDYQKGFNRLIDIWKQVKTRQLVNSSTCQLQNDWQLDIVGEGPLRDELQGQINRLGLQDSVHLLQPTSDVPSLYLQASILAMTSRYEGLPMVLIEAQTYGLPIVAYACQCGPRDIISDGVDGYLIPDGNEACFAERLTSLMSDETLRQQMGAAAAKASERFSEERVMQQWEGVLR